MPAKTETPAANTTPAFVSRPITAIPKRITPESGVDLAKANTLLGLVFADGSPLADGDGNIMTASDGASYAEQVPARSAANKAKRLIKHVTPDGFNVVTRVYQPEGQDTWEWALWIEAAKAAAATKA